MIGSFLRFRTFLLVLFAAAFVIAGLLVTAVPARAQDDQPSNEACLACHQQPSAQHTLPDGEILDVTIDPQAYAASAHESTQCVACHTNITGYPHPENAEVQDVRDYSLMYSETCMECHQEQYEQLTDSVHTNELQAGNKNAPVCSDCHNPHTQPPLQAEEGILDPGQGAMIAQTCAQCHNGIFQEYSDSVHGAGVLEDRNPDTPTCTDCHGVHQIADPTTAEFRLQSPQLCASCHTDKEMMAKYNLSTDVLDTYVSDFHGTTITLFEKTHPDQPNNKPVCYDCHGVHNIVSVDDPQKGIQVKENMLATCQKCHPDASENFSASWMSHYIASPTRYPLVYWVNMFYSIFIPTVLGGMALFVVSDILHRTGITRRKGTKETPTGKES